MRQKFTLGLFLLSLCMTGCSSLAYVSGYNMVSEREIVIVAEKPGKKLLVTCPACGYKNEKMDQAAPFLCSQCGYSEAKYSETAYVIAMLETGGGYLRKSPTLVIGIALSPIFFIVGTISGIFDSGKTTQENRPSASNAPKVLVIREK